MDELRRTNTVAVSLFVFLICVYLISISSAFTSRNSGEGFMRISELENFLITGDIGADSSYKWGTPGRDGKRYNWHQFGQQALVMPFYLFLRREGYAYYFVNLASTALTAVLIMHTLVLLGFRLRESVMSALVFGIGTLAWFYAAKTPHEHVLAVLFVTGGVYYAVKYQKGLGRRNLYLCMLSIGMGFTIRYDVILILLPVSLYFYLGRKDVSGDMFPLWKAALISAALLAPFFLADAMYNYIRFGDILDSGHGRHNPNIKKHWGIEFLPTGLIGSMLSPGRSIFLFSPVLMLFPFYVRAFKRRVDRPFFIVSMSAIVMYLVFYGVHHSWDGDWCFGPRYFLVLGPFMVMAIAPMFESLGKKKTLVKVLLVLLLVFSVLTQVVFVSSNSYLSNVIKYGIDDDSLPELSRQYSRSFGERGSWEWLGGYFSLKYAQFFNQFKIFRYTLMINMDRANFDRVAWEIRNSHAPYLVIYVNLMRDFDFWWLQDRAKMPGPIALIIAAVGVFALYQTLSLSGRKD
jgi:hypothetical protein